MTLEGHGIVVLRHHRGAAGELAMRACAGSSWATPDNDPRNLRTPVWSE